ncbi:hypothetical protein KKE26_08585 [bacterium]|nr:hypothetical protein [bacterium]
MTGAGVVGAGSKPALLVVCRWQGQGAEHLQPWLKLGYPDTYPSSPCTT